ncbi:MAG: hypothetical protein WBA39_05325 [Rivularia sp. (in: cyanobacteria)]
MKGVGFEWYKPRTSKPVLQDSLLLELYLMSIGYTQTCTSKIPYPNSTDEKQAVPTTLLAICGFRASLDFAQESMKRYIKTFIIRALTGHLQLFILINNCKVTQQYLYLKKAKFKIFCDNHA